MRGISRTQQRALSFVSGTSIQETSWILQIL